MIKYIQKKPYNKDIKIYQQSKRLSWTEPEHFIESKRQLFLGDFLSDVFNYLKLIDVEKSPRKKILNVTKIFNSIHCLLNLNGVTSIGFDDEIPILEYVVIKAQLSRFFSNTEFMQLYIGEKINKLEGVQLNKLHVICDEIAREKYSHLIDAKNEEFNENNKKKC